MCLQTWPAAWGCFKVTRMNAHVIRDYCKARVLWKGETSIYVSFDKFTGVHNQIWQSVKTVVKIFHTKSQWQRWRRSQKPPAPPLNGNRQRLYWPFSGLTTQSAQVCRVTLTHSHTQIQTVLQYIGLLSGKLGFSVSLEENPMWSQWSNQSTLPCTAAWE